MLESRSCSICWERGSRGQSPGAGDSGTAGPGGPAGRTRGAAGPWAAPGQAAHRGRHNPAARPLEEKIAATRLFASQVVPWLEQGVVDRSSTLSSHGKRYGRPIPGWRRISHSARSFSGFDAQAATRGVLAVEAVEPSFFKPLDEDEPLGIAPCSGATWPSWISSTRSSGVMNLRSWVTTTSVV